MKNKRFLIVFALICIATSSIFAEKKNKTKKDRECEIKTAVGFNFGCYKETTFANISQGVYAPRFELESRLRFGNFFHIITADYYFCRPDSAMTKTTVLYNTYDPVTGTNYYDVSTSSLNFHKICLQYDLDYRIIKNEKLDFYIGGNFLCNAFLQFEHYPSITGLVSFGTSCALNYRFNEKHSLSFTAGIPLLGYGVRPSYAGCDARLMKYAEENFMQILTLGTFLSIHNYQSLLFNVEYKFQVAKHFAAGLGFDFEYARIDVPYGRPLYYVDGNLKAFMSFNF